MGSPHCLSQRPAFLALSERRNSLIFERCIAWPITFGKRWKWEKSLLEELPRGLVIENEKCATTAPEGSGLSSKLSSKESLGRAKTVQRKHP